MCCLFLHSLADEIEHYEVQRFRDAGLSQDQFVEELMVNFRYTLYAKKARTNANANFQSEDHALGRMKLAPHLFDSASASGAAPASVIHVIDRAGYLGRSFAGMEQLALHRQSTTIEFAHYGLPGQTRFSFIVSPVIAPCLHLLSSYPTLQQLHDANKRFAAGERRDFDEVDAKRRLIKIVSYFEMLNLVTYEGSHALAHIVEPGRRNLPGYVSSDAATAPPPDTILKPVIKTVGGLKISSRGAGGVAGPSQTKKKTAGSDARSPEQRASNMGVSKEFFDRLHSSDDNEALPMNTVEEDGILIDLLKIQTAENS